MTPIIGCLERAVERWIEPPEIQSPLVTAKKATQPAATLTKEFPAFSRRNPLNLKMPKHSGGEILLSAGHDISEKMKKSDDLESLASLPKPYIQNDRAAKIRTLAD